MNHTNNDILTIIKKYRFAELPPRMFRSGEEQEKKDDGRYSVQCQVCGRMGAMTVEDMKKHAETHEGKNN